jgi:tetratricopeptide (TPR) repeat protein
MRLALQIILVISILFVSQAIGENTAEQWKDEAKDYYSSASYELGLDAIDKSLAIDKSDGDALVLKAIILEHLNRYEEAIAAFEMALAMDEDNKEAWAGKGDAYYKLGDYAKAADSYDRSIKLDRTGADVLYKKGLALKEKGNEEEANNIWKEAIRVDPSYAYKLPIGGGKGEIDLTEFANKDNISYQTQITWNFEDGDLRGWRKTGDAFNYQPTYGDNIAARSQGHAGQQGDYWVGTYEKYPGPGRGLAPGDIQGNAPRGMLTSSSFKIMGRKIDFLIGGGSQCSANLVINGSVELSSNGENKETLSRVEWNTSRYKGRTAFIELIDNSSAAWGYISFDDVRFDVSPLTGENRTVIPLEISENVINSLVIKPL